MRTLLLLAPLALLAACNNADTAEKGGDAATVGAAAVAEPAMTVVADAENAIDWTGTYTGTDASGAALSLTLNRGDTYSWSSTPAGGTATTATGNFNWYRDGNRILLDDAGGNAIYAVGNGVIFRMANADAPTTGTMDRATALIRAVAPPAPAAPAQ
jgi:hypothetical protein